MKIMKIRILMITVAVLMVATGIPHAQMGGGNMGPGHMGGGGLGGGMGSGMAGAGGIMPGMMGNTMDFGYLDLLNPIKTEQDVEKAIQAFLDASNSNLVISEIWEYGLAYKAELSDKKESKAFDLIVDKFSGTVMPEMGMSMMLNASFGKSLYKMPAFGKNLTITPDQAIANAKAFVDDNDLGYILGSPETYPGYYKFHTTLDGSPGMDIMVNGYNGKIWMNTLLGVPIGRY